MRTSGTTGAPATAGKQATAGMQATAVTQATSLTTESNSKDDSKSMTAHISSCNSSNESSNRTANTVGTPAKAEVLAKVVKPPTACRGANYNKDIINIRDNSSSMIGNIMGVNSGRPPESVGKLPTVDKPATFGRDASKSSSIS
jgi:hypothetical protein